MLGSHDYGTHQISLQKPGLTQLGIAMSEVVGQK